MPDGLDCLISAIDDCQSSIMRAIGNMANIGDRNAPLLSEDELGICSSKLEAAKSLLDTRESAYSTLAALPCPGRDDYIPRTTDPPLPFTKAPFGANRLLLTQAYQAVVWAVLDSAAEVTWYVNQPQSMAENFRHRGPGSLMVKSESDKKFCFRERWMENLRYHHDWAFHVSYSIRNILMHQGDFFENDSRVFEAGTFSLSEKIINHIRKDYERAPRQAPDKSLDRNDCLVFSGMVLAAVLEQTGIERPGQNHPHRAIAPLPTLLGLDTLLDEFPRNPPERAAFDSPLEHLPHDFGFFRYDHEFAVLDLVAVWRKAAAVASLRGLCLLTLHQPLVYHVAFELGDGGADIPEELTHSV